MLKGAPSDMFFVPQEGPDRGTKTMMRQICQFRRSGCPGWWNRTLWTSRLDKMASSKNKFQDDKNIKV